MRLNIEYVKAISGFDNSLLKAIAVSKAIAGRKVTPRLSWASILFTRLCCSGMSLLIIVPKSRLSKSDLEHWDFSAVASLVRNLMECYLTFFYIAVEAVDDGEWRCRINVMQLHDCISRYRMFRDFDPTDKQLKYFEHQADELRERLLGLKYFISLPAKRRDKLLKGENALLLSRDELITRMGESESFFRGIYRFLSTHVHSLPMSFARIGEKSRGLGLENDVEKGYITECLLFSELFINRATKEIVVLFPDVAKKIFF